MLWAVLLYVVQTGGYGLFFDGRPYYLSNIINVVIQFVFTGILLLAMRAVKKIRSEKCTSLLAAGVGLLFAKTNWW